MYLGEIVNISVSPANQPLLLGLAVGLGVVFILLLVLLGRVSSLAKSLQPAAVPVASAPQPAAAPSRVLGIPPEVVAAISAAVAYLEGDGAVVRSVTPMFGGSRLGVRAPGEWGFAARTAAVEPF